MKKILILATGVIAATQAQSQTLKTHRDSVSYALGVSMAETMKKSGITDYDEATFTRAISESLRGNKCEMDAASADKLYREESKKIHDQKAEAAKREGEAFLITNKSKPGVKTTTSGLQYKTTLEGKGAMPDGNDKVTVHYHGTLVDGTVFDSSVDRGQPATFGLNQVIPGWTEGLQFMKEGGKTTFYIPSNIAYGSRAQGKIAANSTLIFDVELIQVEPVEGVGTPPPPPPPAAAPNEPTKAKPPKENVKEAPKEAPKKK